MLGVLFICTVNTELIQYHFFLRNRTAKSASFDSTNIICICQLCVFEVWDKNSQNLMFDQTSSQIFKFGHSWERTKNDPCKSYKVIRTKKSRVLNLTRKLWFSLSSAKLARDHRLKVQHWEDYPQVQEWAKWDLHSLPSQQVTKSAVFRFETAYWKSWCRVDRTLYSILTVLLVVPLPPTVPENTFWCGAKCFVVKMPS